MRGFLTLHKKSRTRAGFFCFWPQPQKRNTSMSVRIGEAIGIRGLSAPCLGAALVDDVALESVPGAAWTFILPRGRRVDIADPGDGSVVDLAADV